MFSVLKVVGASVCAEMAWLLQSRGSPRLVLVVVCVALLLDNMLLTVVVPIIPTFLYAMEHPSPEPQTLQPSLLAQPSLGAPHLDTVTSQPPSSSSNLQTPSWTSQLSPPSSRTPILSPESQQRPRLSLLVSLFDNLTFTLQESRTEGTPDTARTGLTGRINDTTNTTDPSCLQDSVFLEEENVRVGLLFASKALVQLLVNPFVGPLTNRIGYHIPMFAGFIIMFVSTIMFAFSGTYALLFFARSLQGIGSSFSSVAGQNCNNKHSPTEPGITLVVIREGFSHIKDRLSGK
ncbi:hypothetical protein ATANTOWER_030302 [Ataeniobius toweri]|uniref:Major facilitator superfamily (MFS) profile domain-containing protein n=1 Tax=Ataeniobius toweri TaxID=208326 RepID=A0ABU7BVL5_9TELE|nr:hypothetical protein [Ataeniobius toweri]